MDFAEKIKKIRQTLLMSQRDFANDIGISHITVAIWETGKVKPSLKYQRIIKEYCEKKNVHID
jgi:DNA-binding transcriptional regulator YiaG